MDKINAQCRVWIFFIYSWAYVKWRFESRVAIIIISFFSICLTFWWSSISVDCNCNLKTEKMPSIMRSKWKKMAKESTRRYKVSKGSKPKTKTWPKGKKRVRSPTSPKWWTSTRKTKVPVRSNKNMPTNVPLERSMLHSIRRKSRDHDPQNSFRIRVPRWGEKSNDREPTTSRSNNWKRKESLIVTDIPTLKRVSKIPRPCIRWYRSFEDMWHKKVLPVWSFRWSMFSVTRINMGWWVSSRDQKSLLRHNKVIWVFVVSKERITFERTSEPSKYNIDWKTTKTKRRGWTIIRAIQEQIERWWPFRWHLRRVEPIFEWPPPRRKRRWSLWWFPFPNHRQTRTWCRRHDYKILSWEKESIVLEKTTIPPNRQKDPSFDFLRIVRMFR